MLCCLPVFATVSLLRCFPLTAWAVTPVSLQTFRCWSYSSLVRLSVTAPAVRCVCAVILAPRVTVQKVRNTLSLIIAVYKSPNLKSSPITVVLISPLPLTAWRILRRMLNIAIVVGITAWGQLSFTLYFVAGQLCRVLVEINLISYRCFKQEVATFPAKLPLNVPFSVCLWCT